MTTSAILWLLIALLGIFLIFFAWKRGNVKAADDKGILYLGLIFTTVGLYGWIKYGEWGFLLMGLIFLAASYIKKIGKKSKNLR
jgi:hypothetical protein